MKKLYAALMPLVILAACHESIEERAEREAREYTRKYCPTPVSNYVRTDSAVFDKSTKTYYYYCSVVDEMDNADIMKRKYNVLKSGLLKSIKENTDFHVYKKAGFSFAYVLHSGKNPSAVLFKAVYSPSDYGE